MSEWRFAKHIDQNRGRRLWTTALGVAALLPAVALAHPGHEPLSGLAAGMLHPLTGLDHLLAMLLVGMWSAQRGGHARWSGPLLFVVAMLAGSVFAQVQPGAAALDTVIMVSVLALGLLVALQARLAPWFAAALIAGFAMFHGHAHGVEMPAYARTAFTVGFSVATLSLHLAGVAFATYLLKSNRPGLLRAAGAAAAVSGMVLLGA